MIDLYYYTTPNGRKALMMLEEVRLPYRVCWVDIAAGEQYSEAFGRINPNHRIPALVDHDSPAGEKVVLFESGSILLYLAEKTGRLLPREPGPRWEVLKWLFWQTSSQGPLLGQAVHFVSYAAQRGIENPYAVERYRKEAERLYAVLDARLADRAYIAGDFSIADIASFPWVRVAKGHGIALDAYPHVKRWCDSIAARPSAQKRLERDASAKQAATNTPHDDKTWAMLFGGIKPEAPV